VGSFISRPKITPFTELGAARHLPSPVQQPIHSFFDYATYFTIRLDQPTLILSLSFNEIERFDNWGSSGAVLADGILIGDFFGFGRLPYNDRQVDTTNRFHEIVINKTVSELVLRVHDITT